MVVWIIDNVHQDFENVLACPLCLAKFTGDFLSLEPLRCWLLIIIISDKILINWQDLFKMMTYDLFKILIHMSFGVTFHGKIITMSQKGGPFMVNQTHD